MKQVKQTKGGWIEAKFLQRDPFSPGFCMGTGSARWPPSRSQAWTRCSTCESASCFRDRVQTTRRVFVRTKHPNATAVPPLWCGGGGASKPAALKLCARLDRSAGPEEASWCVYGSNSCFRLELDFFPAVVESQPGVGPLLIKAEHVCPEFYCSGAQTFLCDVLFFSSVLQTYCSQLMLTKNKLFV